MRSHFCPPSADPRKVFLAALRDIELGKERGSMESIWFHCHDSEQPCREIEASQTQHNCWVAIYA